MSFSHHLAGPIGSKGHCSGGYHAIQGQSVVWLQRFFFEKIHWEISHKHQHQSTLKPNKDCRLVNQTCPTFVIGHVIIEASKQPGAAARSLCALWIGTQVAIQLGPGALVEKFSKRHGEANWEIYRLERFRAVRKLLFFHSQFMIFIDWIHHKFLNASLCLTLEWLSVSVTGGDRICFEALSERGHCAHSEPNEVLTSSQRSLFWKISFVDLRRCENRPGKRENAPSFPPKLLERILRWL